MAFVADRALKLLALYTTPVSPRGFILFAYSLNQTGPLNLPLSGAVLVGLGVAALIVVLYLGQRLLWQGRFSAFVGAILVLSGGLSNVFDRLAYGGVVDIFHLTLWGTLSFNLADLWLMGGVMLMLVSNHTAKHLPQVG